MIKVLKNSLLRFGVGFGLRPFSTELMKLEHVGEI